MKTLAEDPARLLADALTVTISGMILPGQQAWLRPDSSTLVKINAPAEALTALKDTWTAGSAGSDKPVISHADWESLVFNYLIYLGLRSFVLTASSSSTKEPIQ